MEKLEGATVERHRQLERAAADELLEVAQRRARRRRIVDGEEGAAVGQLRRRLQRVRQLRRLLSGRRRALRDEGALLRLARQLGYKNTKYLSKIIVTDDMDFYRKGLGPWYGGI